MDEIKRIIKKHNKYTQKYTSSDEVLDIWATFENIPHFLDMILNIFDDLYDLFNKYNMEMILEFIIIRLSWKMKGMYVYKKHTEYSNFDKKLIRKIENNKSIDEFGKEINKITLYLFRIIDASVNRENLSLKKNINYLSKILNQQQLSMILFIISYYNMIISWTILTNCEY